MTKKRLDRDAKWGFDRFPYYHMRVDIEEFHGMVSIIELLDGQYCYWDFLPKAGKTPVCGKGMVWLQLIPDGCHRAVTAKFLPVTQAEDGKKPKSISVWYVDVIDSWGYDEDNVIYFMDQYLDVIFDTDGDVITADRDELDDAYRSGELSEEQYQRALAEGDAIISELCSDIGETQRRCEIIMEHAVRRIREDDGVFKKNV